MSSPPSSLVRCVSDPSSAPTTRKRSASVRFAEVPPLELTANALGDTKKARLASPPPSAPKSGKSRVLPAFIGQKPAESPLSSQESLVGSTDIETLQNAKRYLENRIIREENERNQRYEMCDKSPVGSQASNEVAYSQDSQLSGAEPPNKVEVAKAIANTIPEERFQQLFLFGDLDDVDERVRIMLPFMERNLQCFLDFVNEALDAVESSSSMQKDAAEPVVIGRTPS